MQETDLIKSIIERNDSAMEELLKYYGPLIRYVIGPIVKDVQEQEACVSEVAMRIWEKADTYDPAQGKWTGWITAIARNTALNWAATFAVRGHTYGNPVQGADAGGSSGSEGNTDGDATGTTWLIERIVRKRRGAFLQKVLLHAVHRTDCGGDGTDGASGGRTLV